MENPKTQKNLGKYFCENCDFNTSHKNDYNKHLLTSKHQNWVFGNEMEIIGNEKTQKNPDKYYCEKCEKSFHTNAGLWKHNKKCKNVNELNDNEPTDKELMLMVVQQNALLIKENSDFKNMMMEVIKNGTHNNTIHSNSHNKTFNLQFFLNETCKDAMNIMDFVDSIKIQLSDLENVGKLGYIDGISKIIVQNLNLLDETKRPVHCTDSKREVLYVKDENKWEKENEDKQKMRKVIKHVTHKNTKLFNEFRSKYPGCEKSESKFSNKYDKLIIEAFGGKGDNTDEKEDKIIRKIAKEVTINK